MTLCRLFAFKKDGVDAATLCEPLTVSGSILNSRVAWQLSSMLSAKKLVALPEDNMARLTTDLAAQLETANKLTESAWVLLHLRQRNDRQQTVTGLLQRNAGSLASLEEQLTHGCRIPQSMIFAAQSMYAKANEDAHGQAHFLLRAGQVADAHDVLCSFVGPQAVIEQDYDALALVNEFPTHRPVGWEKGGQVYDVYLRLVLMTQAQKLSPRRREGDADLAESVEEYRGDGHGWEDAGAEGGDHGDAEDRGGGSKAAG